MTDEKSPEAPPPLTTEGTAWLKEAQAKMKEEMKAALLSIPARPARAVRLDDDQPDYSRYCPYRS